MFGFFKKKKEPPPLPQGAIRKRFRVSGRVQGVGFRYTAKYEAQALGLTGWAENQLDGSVELEVQGPPEQIDQLFPRIRKSEQIKILSIKMETIPLEPHERGFQVRGY